MLAKKAHILPPGDRGWGGNIEVVSKSQNMSFFAWYFMKKSENKKAHFLGFGDIRVGGGQFSIVSRRQNMSFFYFASIP